MLALYNDKISCSLCDNPDTEESEVHLLSCPSLINEEVINNEMGQVKFCDVFPGISQQLKAVQVFKRIMDIYETRKRKWTEQYKITNQNLLGASHHHSCLV